MDVLQKHIASFFDQYPIQTTEGAKAALIACRKELIKAKEENEMLFNKYNSFENIIEHELNKPFLLQSETAIRSARFELEFINAAQNYNAFNLKLYAGIESVIIKRLEYLSILSNEIKSFNQVAKEHPVGDWKQTSLF